jgi:hypothetical protein
MLCVRKRASIERAAIKCKASKPEPIWRLDCKTVSLLLLWEFSERDYFLYNSKNENYIDILGNDSEEVVDL